MNHSKWIGREVEYRGGEMMRADPAIYRGQIVSIEKLDENIVAFVIPRYRQELFVKNVKIRGRRFPKSVPDGKGAWYNILKADQTMTVLKWSDVKWKIMTKMSGEK